MKAVSNDERVIVNKPQFSWHCFVRFMCAEHMGIYLHKRAICCDQTVDEAWGKEYGSFVQRKIGDVPEKATIGQLSDEQHPESILHRHCSISLSMKWNILATAQAKLIAYDEMYAHIFRFVCNERGRKVGLSFGWSENECVTQPTIYMESTATMKNICCCWVPGARRKTQSESEREGGREREMGKSHAMPRQTNKPRVFFLFVKLLSYRVIVARALPQFSLAFYCYLFSVVFVRCAFNVHECFHSHALRWQNINSFLSPNANRTYDGKVVCADCVCCHFIQSLYKIVRNMKYVLRPHDDRIACAKFGVLTAMHANGEKREMENGINRKHTHTSQNADTWPRFGGKKNRISSIHSRNGKYIEWSVGAELFKLLVIAIWWSMMSAKNANNRKYPEDMWRWCARVFCSVTATG